VEGNCLDREAMGRHRKTFRGGQGLLPKINGERMTRSLWKFPVCAKSRRQREARAGKLSCGSVVLPEPRSLCSRLGFGGQLGRGGRGGGPAEPSCRAASGGGCQPGRGARGRQPGRAAVGGCAPGAPQPRTSGASPTSALYAGCCVFCPETGS